MSLFYFILLCICTIFNYCHVVTMYQVTEINALSIVYCLLIVTISTEVCTCVSSSLVISAVPYLAHQNSI